MNCSHLQRLQGVYLSLGRIHQFVDGHLRQRPELCLPAGYAHGSGPVVHQMVGVPGVRIHIPGALPQGHFVGTRVLGPALCRRLTVEQRHTQLGQLLFGERGAGGLEPKDHRLLTRVQLGRGGKPKVLGLLQKSEKSQKCVQFFLAN
jgi:hypothetical protein